MTLLQQRLDKLLRDVEDLKVMAQPEEAKFYEGDGPGWPEWARWRIILTGGEQGQIPPVVYFSREPTYSEIKAFAAAGRIPAVSVQVQERE